MRPCRFLAIYWATTVTALAAWTFFAAAGLKSAALVMGIVASCMMVLLGLRIVSAPNPAVYLFTLIRPVAHRPRLLGYSLLLVPVVTLLLHVLPGGVTDLLRVTGCVLIAVLNLLALTPPKAGPNRLR